MKKLVTLSVLIVIFSAQFILATVQGDPCVQNALIRLKKYEQMEKNGPGWPAHCW